MVGNAILKASIMIGTPFKKGSPGGPGRGKGSRNGATVCKQWADSKGFEFLKRVADGTELIEVTRLDRNGKERKSQTSPPLSLRIEAAQYLIDRAYGKATAMHEVDVNGKITLGEAILGIPPANKQPE